MTIEVHLHAFARAYADQRASKGAIFDRKMLRYNDIVAVGVFYSRCRVTPSVDVAVAGVREAVDACVKDTGNGAPDPAYVAGRGPLTMVQEWMVP